MPALSSSQHSFHVHNDPSFYEHHQNLVHSHHHVHYDPTFTRHAHQQPIITRHPPTQVFHHPQPIHVPPPPPTLAHKVWILDCRSCKTFLTNRGMKAVLLLRPNVPLYSTDALPANCSAYSTAPEGLSPSSFPPSRDLIRTCECLTQTLCCHGCGNTVGYMIVIPCQRCTSSMSASNRATNGHRFVFHSSEICASERHHVVGEPGVMPYYTLPPSCPPSPHVHPNTAYSVHMPISLPPIRPSASNPESQQADYLPTPPADGNNGERTFDFSVDASRTSSLPESPTFGRSSITPPLLPARIYPHSSPIQFANSSLPFRPPTPVIVKIKPGDVLYWHHLTKTGEIPAVQEDVRARGKQYAPDGHKEIAIKEEECSQGGVKLGGAPVVCGR